MQIKKLMSAIPIFLWAGLLFMAAPPLGNAAVDAGGAKNVTQDDLAAIGKVLGLSQKARTITIEDKNFGLVMVKFNDDTKGLEYAQKGEAAIVKYKVAGDDKIATVIKPKLAKLPKGVSEIMPDELAAIIADKTDYLLIDSRPGKPYAAGHIPTAISIPVDKLKNEGVALLPAADKNKLLVFYCGGLT